MLGFLGDLLGLNAGNATKDMAMNNQGLAREYGGQAQRFITRGNSDASKQFGTARDYYQPLAEMAAGAGTMYGNALGLNGAEGNAAATEAYQQSPGFQHALDTGLQALDRRRSAAGSFQSGGADIDAMTYATGLADQSYGSWLDRLANPGAVLTGGMTGYTGQLGNLANLALDTAAKRTMVKGEVNSALMGTNQDWAQGEEANKAGIANLGSNLMGLAGQKMGFKWGGFNAG
jgi:hypothetical protein